MGRRKIEIEPITDYRNRAVTFVKRKAGLFKKAYELSVLCDVDLAVIIVGNNKKVFEFSSVDIKELLDSYHSTTLHESKLLENYGNYKKRSHLKSRSSASVNEDSMQDLEEDNDSDEESETSEPKRIKLEPSVAPTPSIYTQKSSVNSRFTPMSGQKQPNQLEQDTSLQRPVLRVQIPTTNKPSVTLERATTDIEGVDEKNKNIEPASQTLQQNAMNYSLRKFKSPDNKKPPLPLPTNHRLQTLSPLSATHPHSLNPNSQYYSLPPPSPSGNFAPSILPTPVFNQVFNLLLMNSINSTGNTLASLSMGTLNGLAPPSTSAVPSSGITQTTSTTSASLTASRPPHLDLASQNSNANNSSLDIDVPKFKPPFSQQAANGEQTPISGLPSRYMNDIFPSPSNFYASQEWPTGMTPYSTSMSHYFVGMMPSAGGTTPLQLSQAYTSTSRNSHAPVAQKPSGSLANTSSQTIPSVDSRTRKTSLSLATDNGELSSKR